MIPLIGFGGIIRKHFDTLYEDANIIYRFVYFLIIPLVIAGVLLFYQKYLNSSSVNALITAFSIFTGLLLNIILIIFAIVGRIPQLDSKKERLLKHLYANSMYALLISTFLLIILIMTIILEEWMFYLLILITSFFVYFGIVHFFMTLLMILRRLFVLLFD